jgi:cysteine desulfurase/selenocysteine lyase
MNSGVPESVREDFPALRGTRNGKPPIYLDNACTTLVPHQVVEAISEYYSGYPGCAGGRSRYWFSEEVSARIEGDPERGLRGSRRTTQEFINAGSEKEIIFTPNASHAINSVALGYGFSPGDVVLLTEKEHNSNLIPWLRLRDRGVLQVSYIGSNQDDSLDLDRLEQEMEGGKVRLVSMAYTSNLTGYTIPAESVIEIAHDHGAKVLLDAAQTVPHQAVDVQHLDVDFLAFSAHKMCGPRGVGVLYAKKELLAGVPDEKRRALLEPTFLGGGTVRDSTYESYSLLDPPERFEVGIQDYPAQIAAGTAVEYLKGIGMDHIGSHVTELNSFLTEQLLSRYGDKPWFRILGPRDASKRGSILTMDIRRPNAMGIAAELDERSNVMVRDGALCVNSYLNKLFGRGWIGPNRPSEHRTICRVSLYFYNTMEECQTFLDTLDKIFKERSYL